MTPPEDGPGSACRVPHTAPNGYANHSVRSPSPKEQEPMIPNDERELQY